ncbi:C-X-C motif chemokine 5-like [Centropristis striata]|uniref:C-X-C motif chemokine 5-like n=1 Tax=Centropristis striata TaxID=184440 RepID=UPI0027DFAB4B|nr:C-X-C motif chemokine 5-like [Centropristis striata]
MSVITVVALLVLLTIPEGISVGGPGGLDRCVCLSTEKKPIGRFIGMVEVIPVNSYCDTIQIIATLKKGGKVCLDPDARWVKKVLEKLSGQTP